MEFTLNVKMDNAAFNSGDDVVELVRIIRAAANNVEKCGDANAVSFNCRDINGNKVGSYQVTV